MKKFNNKMMMVLVLVLIFVMAFGGVGCSSSEPDPVQDPAAEGSDAVPQEPAPAPEGEKPEWEEGVSGLEEFLPLDFIFSSGAGGWGTSLTLNADGTFEGVYHDSEMGLTGEDHPNGTYYISEFAGKFGSIEARDPHSYTLTLKELSLSKDAGEEWIEDEILYIASDAMGIHGGEEFILYKPGTPLEELSEDVLHWWPDWYLAEEEGMTELNCWGLVNTSTNDSFFTFALE